MNELDAIDAKILSALQFDCQLSQREVAEKIGLSQNACWRRLKRLQSEGFISGYHAALDQARLGLDLTVFVLIRTRQHSRDWAEELKKHVAEIPEVTEMHRIGGDWDYLLKVVTTSMAGYDAVYRQLTSGMQLETVTGLFSMEPIFSNRPLTIKP